MRKLLLVEDNRTMLLFMEKVLIKRNFDVVTAMNGKEALVALEANPDIQFVLSDWMMPEMDGIALCRHLKATDYSRYIFFMLLSGKDDRESIVRGINAGADDFVIKNTHVDELSARIEAGFRTLVLHNEVIAANKALDTANATMKKDLESAGDLLRKLLPKDKNFTGVDISYISLPSAQIGGDMLGYMQLDESHICFYLLDVAGHGVSSALMSFSVQQSLNNTSESGSVLKTKTKTPPYYRLNAPHEVVKKLNDLYVSEEQSILYFTMVYAVLNVHTGQLAFSIGGHPPIVWYHADTQTAEFIGQDSFVVGTFDFVDYETAQVQLQPGDKIWMYSDGITEAEKGSEQFSEEGLKNTVVELKQHELAIQTEMLLNKVRDWQQSNDFDDDVSVLAVGWNGNAKEDNICNTKLASMDSAPFFE